MRYKLKNHVTDEMLVAAGFEFQSTGLGLVHAWRQCGDDEIYFVKTWGDKESDRLDNNIKVLGWNTFGTKKDIRPYIKDLIELGYVGEL